MEVICFALAVALMYKSREEGGGTEALLGWVFLPFFILFWVLAFS